MKLAAFLAVSIAACAAPAAAQQPSVITNPDWLRRPVHTDMEQFYPKAASFLQIEGRASIQCSVLATGLLHACTVLNEAPAAMGFGPAALRLSELFMMRPMTRDGQPVSGGTVRVPIRFKLPPRTPIAPAPPRASAENILLAQRLAGLGSLDGIIRRGVEETAQEVEATDSVGTPEDTRLAAAAAFRTAVGPHRDEIRDMLAAMFAESFTAQELREINGDLEAYIAGGPPPPPRPYVDKRLDDWNAKNSARLEALEMSIADTAHEAFCREHDCSVDGGKP